MEGREFGPPPPLLTERVPLAHRGASRITAAGHAAVQHPAAFQPGKYYPSHIPIPPQSGTGLMANSSASFMGTFLASSLGTPPSHASGPPSSPSSPPYRSGPHSSSHSQIWFPHPHEAPGYSRFSGSLAPTFLPMSPLDHHGNSSVLYGQHRFYNTSKDFYIRSLSSQPHLLPTNHNLPSLTTPSHPLGSCSRERDPGGGGPTQKSSKESDIGERVIAAVGKDKEKSKQEVKDRQHHDPPSPVPHHHQHLHPHHHPQFHPLGPEENPRHKDDPKHLSACLLSTKTHNGPHTGTAVRGSSLPSCVGPGALSLGTGPKVGGGNICCQEVSGEMRISEPPSDCLRHSAMLGHTHPVSYTMPPPLRLGSAVGGSWPHPIHSHPHHPHADLYCPPAPLTMSSAQDKSLAPGAVRDRKIIGPTFVPSVGSLGDKSSGPFQLGNPHCQGLRGMVDEVVGEGIGKAKASEKSSNGGRIAPPPPAPPLPTPIICHKKSSHQQQQDVYGKTDKGPDWSLGPHSHLPHQSPDHQPHSNLPNHSYSSEAAENSSETDAYQPSLPQGAKDGCQTKNSSYASTPPFRDCSHLGSPNRIPSESKPSNESGCALQRDNQRIARVHHHQENNKTGIQDQEPDLGPSSSFRDRRKQDVDIAAQVYTGHHARSSWEVRGQQSQPDDERRKAYDSCTGDQGSHPPFPSHQQPSIGPHGPEHSAMKNLLKYSGQQPHLLSQKSSFGGLGTLKQGAVNGGKNDRSERNQGSASCAHQEGKQTLPSRRASSSGESERSERVGRDSCEGEGEVRQPPVGIAVAVARQREPLCRPPDRPATHSRRGRVLPSMKGIGRSIYPVEREVEEERKSISEEQLSLPPLDRERDLLLRENKDLVEFARIHPSSSCHGDLTSHLIIPGGSQLGADPSVHTHPAHHWMPRTGSPSLWIGHSYGLSHAALHQNLPPGFSAAMPSPLQPVLPLPQDPSPALVVLPTEPASHPAAHHLDVMEQQGLWPPVYGARGPASHIQHSSVYSRQFLRQQELYMLQQHQHQQHHRAAQAMELAHRHTHSQRKPEDPPVDLDEGPAELHTLKSAKPFSYPSSYSKSRSSSSPGGCASRLSPCCHSPAPRTHPKSTPCTPCPEPSPAVAAPRSPALSPHATPHLPKEAESQDKRGEGQAPQEYPHSLEPDLPPGYTYPAIAIGYKAGPSPQEVQLAEHADLEAEQTEPAEPVLQPLPLSTMGKGPVCQKAESPVLTAPVGPNVEDDLAGNRVMAEKEELSEERKGMTCPPTSPSVCQQPSTSPCQDASPIEEVSQIQTSNTLTPNQPNFLEVQDSAKEVKTQEEDIGNIVQVSPAASLELHSVELAEDVQERTEKICISPSTSVDLDITQASSPSSPCSEISALGNQYPGSCIWSLELLIAAALCATRDAQLAAPVEVPACIAPPQNGMALLSELAELERQQQEKNGSNMASAGEERLLIDLESLATLAAARALEVNPPITTESFLPLRRTLNLRRKWKWTQHHEPACPVKSIMETLDREELAMRVQLAELQRRYKEKQKELSKLQRKHDHQKEDTSRSPARRGPGRPRKRKPTPGPAAPTDTLKRVKLVGAASGLLAAEEELAGGGDKHTKRKKTANSTYDHISGTQVPCRQRGRPRLLSSRMAQLKQKANAKHGSGLESIFCHREKTASGSSAEQTHRNMTGQQSETGSTDTAVPQNLDGQRTMMRRGCRAKISHGHASSSPLQTRTQQMMPNKALTNSKQEVTGKDSSSLDSELSEQEEEGDGIYDIQEVPEDIKNLSSKSPLSGACASSSSTLKLGGQKAKNNKQRQGFGPVTAWLAKGEMKHRKRAPCRPSLLSEDRNCLLVEKRQNALRWRRVSQESSLHRNKVLKCIPNPLERTSGKDSVVLGKKRSCLLETVPSHTVNWNRKLKVKQDAKRRGMRQLLESFAAEEGFHMDDDSSFSEGDEELEEEEQHKNAVPALPNCVLTKEALRDGLKVLISKEDELLYAAYVHTLDLPDIYSIVIEGERGNRPRIYSLEQLLQEAVLDVQLETVDALTDGTRVCAYWSERSRCLYPGYVCRGGPGDEQKEGSVMVEFDDGDRGWISLHSIRLLPPGYQIYCAEPSPALLASPTRRRRKSSTQEKISQQIDVSSEWHGNTEPGKTIKAKPGRPKSVTLSPKSGVSENVTGSAPSLLTWSSVTMSRKRPSLDLFQFNGLSRKAPKEKATDMFPLLGSTMGTPAKGIFSTSFEVDSFSSIANGFTTFGNKQPPFVLQLGQKGTSNVRGRKTGDRKEYLIKLDHEGVTSPKTKNGKALMLLGNGEFESTGGRIEKGSGTKNIADLISHTDCSQSNLLMKDAKRSNSHLLKGSSDMRKHSQGLGLGEYPDYVLNCHSDCLSSYSDMDEDDEEDARRSAMRNPRRFLSHLSISSSSSGSSSSSSSGSLSSSSACSSDNDSSYSSDEEESSQLLLQGCLSSHHAVLQQQQQQQQHPEPTTAPTQHSFIAKAMAVTSPKVMVSNGTGKHQRRKEIPSNSLSTAQTKSSKDCPKKQKTASPTNSSAFVPARQLWRWSGNPTQRRGLKGKARKLFYKAIVRGKDIIRVGDCAVFLSSGRPHLPYIGRIESLWESWASNMVVKVKWFYHPEETKLGKRHRDGKHALYQSCHEDENDVQTISHKCLVVSRAEYEHLSRLRKPNNNSQDLYYLAGTYDPTSGQLVTAEGVSIIC